MPKRRRYAVHVDAWRLFFWMGLILLFVGPLFVFSAANHPFASTDRRLTAAILWLLSLAGYLLLADLLLRRRMSAPKAKEPTDPISNERLTNDVQGLEERLGQVHPGVARVTLAYAVACRVAECRADVVQHTHPDHSTVAKVGDGRYLVTSSGKDRAGREVLYRCLVEIQPGFLGQPHFQLESFSCLRS